MQHKEIKAAQGIKIAAQVAKLSNTFVSLLYMITV